MPFTDFARPDGEGIRFALWCEELSWYGTLVWRPAAAGPGGVMAGAGVAATVALVAAIGLGTAPAVQYATATDRAIARRARCRHALSGSAARRFVGGGAVATLAARSRDPRRLR